MEIWHVHSSLVKKTFSNRALKTTVAANQENKGWTGLCKPTQRFSEVVCAHLEKKKKAKQDRHYCSFCDRVCQHPLSRGTPVNVTRSPHTGTHRAQTQLGSSKTEIRRAPAAHDLPVLLSSVLQHSPESTGSSWVKKQLFTEHWAVALSCPWLMACTQPGQAGKAEPGLTLLAGTVPGAAVSSAFCQQPFMVPAAQPSFQREERITKVCKCFSIYSVIFRNVITSISKTEASHFYQYAENQFAACN